MGVQTARNREDRRIEPDLVTAMILRVDYDHATCGDVDELHSSGEDERRAGSGEDPNRGDRPLAIGATATKCDIDKSSALESGWGGG